MGLIMHKKDIFIVNSYRKFYKLLKINNKRDELANARS